MLSTTIKLTRDTVKRLKEHGEFGESFEDVVSRMLDDLEDDEPDAE